MKKVKRNYVWETASSAVHSLVIAKEGLEKSYLPIDEDGYIVTDFGDFGDYDVGIETFDQRVKLSYLLTELYYLNHWDEDLSDFYQYQCLEECLCEYTGAKGIRIMKKVEPSFNHQVIPEYETKFCSCYDDESIINFIFNKYAGINMSHD